MRKIRLLGMTLLLVAVAVAEAAGQAATAGGAATTPPAPAPGSAGIFRSQAELQAVLQRAIAEGDEPASSSITLTDQYRASLIRRTEPNGALSHRGNTELHYIVEGSGTVVTGGT